MTPTLMGRWQSRLFLLGTLGLLVTIPFILATRSFVALVILIGVIAIGFGWDVLYTVIQKFRWDHDWPPVLQLAAGLVEFIFIGILIYGLSLLRPAPPVGTFVLHYWLVWIVTFAASQSVMRIIFPRWRFKGGQWV